MSDQHSNDQMLEIYIFETSQILEQLEQCVITSEQVGGCSEDAINEAFRFMHTIKGSSAMMLFNNIELVAHSMEDLLYFLREQKPKNVDFSILSDFVLDGVDFIKIEIEKIKNGDEVNGDNSSLVNEIKEFLMLLKSSNNKFKATILFQDGCEMENVRAYGIIHKLTREAEEVFHIPQDIEENGDSNQWIREAGFEVFIKTEKSYEEIYELLMKTVFLKDLKLMQLKNDDEFKQFYTSKKETVKVATSLTNQSLMSVNVDKLDKLMDLVGEMVITEAMVTQNPEVKELNTENFQKATRQLHKITKELQDMVMSIRMVPLSTTFLKMQRILRDMCKKLKKEVTLEIIGEETEVDKNIIEHISDPLMHLIRNAIDHGIEDKGIVTLEAKNSGSDVLVIIKDDGKGLNKDKIIKKAKEQGLMKRLESEMSDKEIYNLILLPGFSTNNNVTEFSGRGVGMDVVCKNIEKIGGTVSINSIENKGTTIILKIPLTLAIIDGMNIRVGNARYTIPTIAIKESFRPKKEDLVTDPEGNEMIVVRGQCLSIIRIHEYYNIKTNITEFQKGIFIMVEQNNKNYCIFADELIGQQQVVVKGLPKYIRKNRKIKGVGGCTLLGDGSISLILDIGGLNTVK